MTAETQRFVCALTSFLLCACPGLSSAAKVRLYSDRYCGTFSAERTQSDTRLTGFNVWSMQVESGAWYARVGEDNAGKRFPAESDKAYTPEDRCVAFTERVSTVSVAQWLVYEECGAACGSEACMKARGNEEFRSLSYYVKRLRDTGHVVKLEECLEQARSFSLPAGKKTTLEVANCACECLPLYRASPPTAANRDRIKSLPDNCASKDGVAASPAQPPAGSVNNL